MAVLRQDGLLAGDPSVSPTRFTPEADAGYRLEASSATCRWTEFAKKVPFTGVFRLPFVFPALAGDTPLYLVDPPNFGVPPTFGIAPVAANEMAIGFPTVKFEISF